MAYAPSVARAGRSGSAGRGRGRTGHLRVRAATAVVSPMPQSVAVLSKLLDLRTPLSLTPEDCQLIGRIVQLAATIAQNEHPDTAKESS